MTSQPDRAADGKTDSAREVSSGREGQVSHNEVKKAGQPDGLVRLGYATLSEPLPHVNDNDQGHRTDPEAHEDVCCGQHVKRFSGVVGFDIKASGGRVREVSNEGVTAGYRD